MTRMAVFDRDATIIDVVRDEATGAITVAFHPNQLRFLPGAIDGMRALQDAGYVLAIATNQPGPAKGQFSAEAVRRTNDALVARLAQAGIRVAALETCMHHPEGGAEGDPALAVACDCRKPKPGMLVTLARHLQADTARSWMIGDSSSDVEAGRAIGMKTALVFAQNRCELCPLRAGPAGLVPDEYGASPLEVARAILRRE